MKRFLLLYGVLLNLTASAQTPNPSPAQAPPGQLSPPPPGPLQPANSPQPFAVPDRSGATNFGAALGGFTNEFGLAALTNEFGTELVSDLRTVLIALQNDVQQTLPLLSAITSGTGAIGFPEGSQSLTGAVSQSGVNLGTRFGANLSGNASANISSSAAQTPGASAGTTPTTPTTTPGGPTATTAPGTGLAPTGVRNPFGARSGFATTTNSLSVSPQTIEQLIVLQNDLQRALPVIAALNGNLSVEETSGFVPPTNVLSGNFVNPLSNRFINPLTNQSRILAPNAPR